MPLTVRLGPGLMGSMYDGLQRPLEQMRREMGPFIRAWKEMYGLDYTKRWNFTPAIKPGDELQFGKVIGQVQEGAFTHYILCGSERGKVVGVASGSVSLDEPFGELESGLEIPGCHEWPVRMPRPYKKKFAPSTPLVTGQRIIDFLFPLARGGAAIIPGGFGTGKTIFEQSVAKFADVDIVVYVGCGERGNEMTEVLTDFPELEDPCTGRPLMERTVLVVNTSNMPVAAREASVYTGITIAEYYRDMGYRVALMADSISRWAEALREISSRLEEMPGEEGYPTYLATRLAGFYERGGRVVCLGDGGREGTVTIVSAVSPPGGDFSEPVTQSSQRIAGVLWALDPDLAHRRHFPAVDWRKSYSLYAGTVDEWFRDHVSAEWPALRGEMMGLLQREEELQEIVQLVGIESLQDQERIVLLVSGMLREDFLRQSAFSENDAASHPEKTYYMLKAILSFHSLCRELLGKGIPVEKVLALPFREELGRMKELPAEGFREEALALIGRIEAEGRAGP
ncbi:MAG: V-type ATP synthase subunit A [Deltaproteobacteria bacterium]|nr:MAG: V-type ATP synthase subunit A [Deltaproteobacteria bacterium]